MDFVNFASKLVGRILVLKLVGRIVGWKFVNLVNLVNFVVRLAGLVAFGGLVERVVVVVEAFGMVEVGLWVVQIAASGIVAFVEFVEFVAFAFVAFAVLAALAEDFVVA